MLQSQFDLFAIGRHSQASLVEMKSIVAGNF